jgi:4a-hydroxytetrahydrobiopterin dehydratase
VTAATRSPRPRANSISVADGTREAIRTETRMTRLSDEEIEERLADRDGWERSGDAIVRQFDNGDFKGSVDFVNRLTPEAEEMNHHPDLEISWKTVTVTITTHSEGGLTEGDFELARRIDALG